MNAAMKEVRISMQLTVKSCNCLTSAKQEKNATSSLSLNLTD